VLLGLVEAPDEKTAELAARQFCGVGAAPPIFRGAINEQSNSDLLLGFIFVSLPFEFFQKRGPQKVGDANKFMPRRALNLEEHGVRYAGLDRSAVGSRKYFTALALSKGVGLRLSGHSPSVTSLRLSKDTTAVTGVLFHNASFFGHPRNALGRHRLRLRLASGYSHGPHQNDNSIIRGDHTIFGMASPPNYPNFLDNAPRNAFE
jgi:hypothetical protein